MNDHEPNEIELRLQAMQPAEPGPAVSQRIAESLGTESGQTHASSLMRYRVLVGLATAAVITIASLVLLFLLDQPTPAPDVADSLPPSQQDDVVAPPQAMPAEPTLLVLNNALRESPQQVVVLLDRIGAERLARTTSDSNPVYASAGSPGADLYKDLP